MNPHGVEASGSRWPEINLLPYVDLLVDVLGSRPPSVQVQHHSTNRFKGSTRRNLEPLAAVVLVLDIEIAAQPFVKLMLDIAGEADLEEEQDVQVLVSGGLLDLQQSVLRVPLWPCH